MIHEVYNGIPLASQKQNMPFKVSYTLASSMMCMHVKQYRNVTYLNPTVILNLFFLYYVNRATVVHVLQMSSNVITIDFISGH